MVRQSRLLSLSRSTAYYTPRGEGEEDLTVMKEIDRLYMERPTSGSRTIYAVLSRRCGRSYGLIKLDVGAQTLPASFAVRGNYPNPLPALVTVEIMDVTGRRVLTAPSVGLAAGWEHRIEDAVFGTVLYRLIAASPEGSSTHVGRFVRISMEECPRGPVDCGHGL